MGIFFYFLIFSTGLEAASFNTQNFRPSPDFGPYLSVMGSHPLIPGRFNLGFSIDHTVSPLSLFNALGGATRDVIGNELALHVAGQAGILPWLDFGFIFSMVPSMEFRAPDPAALSSTESRLADMQFDTRLMVVNNHDHVLGLALVPFINLSTGSGDHFVGNGAVTGGGTLVIESQKIGQRFSLAVNLGYEARPTTTLTTGTVVGDFIRYGVGANLALSKRVDLIAETSGLTFTDSFFSKGKRPTEVEGAVRIHAGERMHFTLGGGTGILAGIGSPSTRFLAEAGYHSGPRKKSVAIPEKEEKLTDEEKITQKMTSLRERCPLDPSEYNPKIHDAECWEYFEVKKEIQSLAHGTEQEKFQSVILRLKKNCPTDPSQFDAAVHEAGCSKFYHFKEEVVTLKGSGKGTGAREKFSEVLLRLKKNCPADPAQFNPEVHDAGCPKFFKLKKEVAALEIPKKEVVPEKVQKIVAVIQKMDRDGDGVPDALDLCPDLKEDYRPGTPVDGCPNGVVQVREKQVGILEPIYFGFNQVGLGKKSEKILSDFVKSFTKRSEIKSLEVIGYADNRGTTTANEKISYKRAQVVIQFLRRLGLSEKIQLVPLGVGSREPVASNKTPEGRRENRRVIFNAHTP